MAALEKFTATTLAAAAVILAGATFFTGYVAVNTSDLSENYGRLDEKVGRIEADVQAQTALMNKMQSDMSASFARLDVGLDRINLRLGQAEIDPDRLLTADLMKDGEDIKAVFHSGSLYYIPKSKEADSRLAKAGFKRDLLEGFLPGYLVREDAFKLVPVKE